MQSTPDTRLENTETKNALPVKFFYDQQHDRYHLKQFCTITSLHVLTSIRVRTCGVRRNQAHSIHVQCLEVLNLDVQPNLLSSKFYY